jgi:hypothetical protein
MEQALRQERRQSYKYGLMIKEENASNKCEAANNGGLAVYSCAAALDPGRMI